VLAGGQRREGGEWGRLAAAGNPSEIRSCQRVIEACLGEESGST